MPFQDGPTYHTAHHMSHETLPVPEAPLMPRSGTVRCRARYSRSGIAKVEAVTVRPNPAIARNGGQASTSSSAARIPDGGVNQAVDRENRNIRPPCITGNVDRMRVANRAVVGLIEGPGHRRKGRDAPGHCLVAGQLAGHPTALALARGIYPALVDAILPLELVENRGCEGYVIGGYIGRALPCELCRVLARVRLHEQRPPVRRRASFALGYTTM